jgi:replicative DNA helicase
VNERVMPHSLDSERSVLGSVLIDNEAYAVAANILRPEMFYRDGHQRIWRHIGRLHEAGTPMDILTVKESLASAGELDDAGGYAYVAGLIDGVPRATNVEAYSRTVRDKFSLRRSILGAMKVIDAAYAGAESADEVIDQAERYVMDLSRETIAGDFVLADDWARELYGQIEHAHTMKQAVTGVPTGFPKLDLRTRGFQPADLIFIAARPSVGKTSLMMQIASHASESTMTGVVSLEMKRRDVGFRLVSTEARVNLHGLQTGFLGSGDYERVGNALSRLGSKKLAIDDASGLTDAQLRARVRRFSSRYGLGIVFVDYLQLLTGEKSENRNLEVSKMSRGLKGLAKDLNIPVVLLSQLNRDNEKTNRRPRLSDLRDSGSLEQDADVVLLLHRPQQHEDGEGYKDGEKAELIIAKQRNGPTGIIDLMWMGSQVRFGELDTQRASA